MEVIQKAKETMTAKQRVQKTFAMEKTDRVTIGYEAHPVIHASLVKALGLASDDMESVYGALGVDYRGIDAPYIGPELYKVPEGRRVRPLEGAILRWVEHKTGGYWDNCDFPLKDATDEAFYAFPVPNPDHFDYDTAVAHAKSYDSQYGLHVSSPNMPDVINSNSRIMGMEDFLCHLISGNEAAMDFVKRRAAFHLGMLERLLDKCSNLIDFMWIGEDLGTQIAPMIGLNLYRRTLKPIHKTFCDLAKAYNIPVLVHSCGSSSWVYEDFIEIGVRGVDTLQPEAFNMSPKYLKEHFGGRLCFRGCISTAGPLVTGTRRQVDEVCRDTLEIMMECRGYHFAPTHRLQDDSPVENVIAMYNAAHKYGVY